MLSACRARFEEQLPRLWPSLSVSVRIPPLFAPTQKEVVATVKEIIQTDHAPHAIGPYSQAVKAGGLVFASGQIPTDPQTGQFVAGGIEEQTVQVLKNLAAVLEAAGSDLSRVVKTTVFLADMQEFAAMNDVYGKFFREQPPARATVEAARLPRDARVEIEAIALAS
jgi:2-iminobutanoate/2-iminopropanoate deaminase